MRNVGQRDLACSERLDPVSPMTFGAFRLARLHQRIENGDLLAIAREIVDECARCSADSAVLDGTQNL